MNLLEFTCASGRKVPVEISRRKATRHMRLRLSVRNHIIVSLPWHCSTQTCLKFIEQQREWLEAQIQAAPELVSVQEWLRRSPSLSVAGQSLAVSVEVSTRACAADTLSLEAEEEREVCPRARASYHIDLKKGVVVFKLPADADDLVWYALLRDFAQKTLALRVAVLASERRFPSARRYGRQVPDICYTRVSVRDQSYRWGSCSSRKTITLNWRLVLIAPQLQDYVIWHELAHLAEMNHSKRFWALLEIYDPKRKIHEKELNAVTPEVMRVCKG